MKQKSELFVAHSYSRGTVVKLAAEAFWVFTFLQQNFHSLFQNRPRLLGSTCLGKTKGTI
jgi:hypothetical protein